MQYIHTARQVSLKKRSTQARNEKYCYHVFCHRTNELAVANKHNTPGRQKRKNLLSLLEPNKETYWKPYYKENLLRKPNKYKSKDWILMVSSCENNSWNSSTTRQNNSSSSLLTLAPASASELKPATLAPTRHDAGKPRKQAQCQEGA